MYNRLELNLEVALEEAAEVPGTIDMLSHGHSLKMDRQDWSSAITRISSTLFDFPFVISLWAIVLSVGFSFANGIVAGVIPARSAARLDPNHCP